MKFGNRVLLATVASVVAMVLAGCPKEGPAERAGKSVDKAVESVKDAAKGDKK